MSGALLGLVGFFYVLIFVGKHIKQPKWKSLLFVTFISILQVTVVLFFIFNLKSPLTR